MSCDSSVLRGKKIKLAGDASDVGVGAVLLQEGKDKIDLTNCYFSKNLDKHQKKYSSIEKECLAFNMFNIQIIFLQH